MGYNVYYNKTTPGKVGIANYSTDSYGATASMTFPISEVQNLQLDKRAQSPDGYTFEYLGYRGGGGLLGELFGSRRRYESSCTLKKDSAYFDLPAPMPELNYYSQNLSFIGWVIDEGNAP